MSLEAQFYEARRRQSAIQRRLSLRTEKEVEKQTRYRTLYIPVRLLVQTDKHDRCSYTALPRPRFQLVYINQSLYQRDRDIYPRPLPEPVDVRRHIRRAKLPKRFSSTDYLQQW